MGGGGRCAPSEHTPEQQGEQRSGPCQDRPAQPVRLSDSGETRRNQLHQVAFARPAQPDLRALDDRQALQSSTAVPEAASASQVLQYPAGPLEAEQGVLVGDEAVAALDVGARVAADPDSAKAGHVVRATVHAYNQWWAASRLPLRPVPRPRVGLR